MNQTTNSYLMEEKPLTDFHTYYRKKIRPYLLDLERKRKQLQHTSEVNQKKYMGIAVAIGLALSLFTYRLSIIGPWSWAFSIILLLIPPLVMKYWLAPVMQEQANRDDQHEAFYNRYKSKVVEAIVRFFDPSLRLQYEEQISKGSVRKSQLVQNLSQIELSGDDFVSGSVDKLAVSFSELQLRNVSNKTSRDIFHGVFFSAVLKHYYEGAIFILPRTILDSHSAAEDEAGSLYQESPLKPHHRAHNISVMEKSRRGSNPWSPEQSDFELSEVELSHEQAKQYYAVYSTHGQHTQKILSEQFWNILFPTEIPEESNTLKGWNSQDEFIQAVSKGYHISLIGDSLYLMQPQGGELFEPDMEHSFLDEESFFSYHDHLQQAFSMMGHIHKEVGIIDSYS